MKLRQINLFWALLGFLFFIFWLFLREKDFLLPIPDEKNIHSAEMIFQGKNFKLEKKQGNWEIKGKNAEKFAELLKKLKSSCRGEFLAKDFDIKADREDLTLKLNQNEKILEFSVNNPVFGANILKIADKIYLCPESYKLRLIQLAVGS